jgi:hypothetical protein
VETGKISEATFSRAVAVFCIAPVKTLVILFSIMSVSKVSKKETFSDCPLSPPEIELASQLLLRAAKNDQTKAIMNSIKNAPNSKVFWVSVNSALEWIQNDVPCGSGYPGSSMTDASKRRFPDDDAASWEQVSSNGESVEQATYIASLPEHVAVPPPWKDGTSPVLKVMMEAKEDIKVSFPPDVTDLRQWGQQLCLTEKYKDANLSYYELLTMAKNDTDVRQYLQFIKSRYGQAAEQAKSFEKMTPGRDLARFLLRYGWNSSDSKATFSRQFKS